MKWPVTQCQIYQTLLQYVPLYKAVCKQWQNEHIECWRACSCTYKFKIPVSFHFELKANTEEILNFIKDRDVSKHFLSKCDTDWICTSLDSGIFYLVTAMCGTTVLVRWWFVCTAVTWFSDYNWWGCWSAGLFNISAVCRNEIHELKWHEIHQMLL